MVERQFINNRFWAFSWAQRRVFVFNLVRKSVPCTKAKGKGTPTRPKLNIYTYHFKTSEGDLVKVCKRFFLTTLGFKFNNDDIVRDTFKHIDQKEQAVEPCFMKSKRKGH